MTREGTYTCPHCGHVHEVDDDTWPQDGSPFWYATCEQCGEVFWCRCDHLTLNIVTEK